MAFRFMDCVVVAGVSSAITLRVTGGVLLPTIRRRQRGGFRTGI
jgi:hypothetical protein